MNKGRLLALCVSAAVALTLAGGPASAGEDAEAGKKVFKKCKACHSIKAGKHKTGPSLVGIVGRQAGTTKFKRYKGLKGADFIWDEALLDEYLADPKKFVKKLGAKKSSMTFKLKKSEQRKAVIAYLKTLE